MIHILKNRGKMILVAAMLFCILLTSCSGDDKSSSLPAAQQQSTVQPKPPVNPETPDKMEEPEITEIKKQEKVVSSWDEYDASRFPLIAAIPEKDIYLYGIKGPGVVLYVGNDGHSYNWPYLTPRFVLPQMDVGDYDGDGKDELAVVNYVGSGTGVSIDALELVEISEPEFLESGKEAGNPNPEYFKDHAFNDYSSQIHKAVSFRTFTKAGGPMGSITAGAKTWTVSLKDYQTKESGPIESNLVLDSIVKFSLENHKLKAEFGVGITTRNYASPNYIGNIDADVSYRAGQFKLSNFQFKENEG